MSCLVFTKINTDQLVFIRPISSHSSSLNDLILSEPRQQDFKKSSRCDRKNFEKMRKLIKNFSFVLVFIFCSAGTSRSQLCEDVADVYGFRYPKVNELSEPDTIVALAPKEEITGDGPQVSFGECLYE